MVQANIGTLDMAELLIKLAQGDGWAGLDEETVHKTNAAESRKAREAQMREARIVASAFETPDGQRLLAWLMGKTLAAPVRSFEMDSAEFVVSNARRQGRNLLMQEILTLLAVARGDDVQSEVSE